MMHLLVATIPILSQLEDVMQHVLNFFHSSVGLPWAWSIVATTVARPDDPRPADDPADPLDAVPAAARAADEGIQKKYKHDKQKQNEELMKFYRENKINPAASCLPMLLQIPVFISLYYTLKHFSDELPCTSATGSDLSWLASTLDPGHHRRRRRRPHWGGYVLLVVYVASQMASRLFMAPTADKSQRMHLHAHAALLRLRHRALPGRARSLLGHDEPLDGRARA